MSNGKTPDRFPGEEQVEGLEFETATADPDAEGKMRYYGGSFKAKDASGVFNLRSGSGGITEEEHRTLDQLVHDLAEDYYEEYTYTGNKVTNITVWTDSGKTKKIREEQYTYSGSRVTQVVTIQYDSDGNEFERLTESYTYASGSRIDYVDAVRSVP